MKRFLCTTCGKVRRVRRLPENTRENFNAHKPTEKLIGSCRWHDSDGESRTKIMDRGRVVAGLGSTRKTSASSAKSKSKK